VTDLPKLVRDRIPAIARANGDDPSVHVADDAEYERRLREKLVEEAEEFAADGGPEELADVLEVVAAVREHRGIDADELARMRAAKADERGGFEAGYVLESVED
jgi:predicted house-cleaning noncanonical NTP pyrophosphatase (MazG superfamily)